MKLAVYQRPPIHIAVMGLGRAFFSEHLPLFVKHPALFQVVAACDTSKDRRDLLARHCPNCRMFRQLSDMLDEPDLDLVLITTPTARHVADAMESLKRGYWTLVESPLALTIDDAQMLRGLVQKAKNRLLMVNRGLFEPDFLLTCQTMTDARLGRVYEIAIRKEDYIRRDDWQSVKRTGGGAAFYAMPDLIQQALRLLPSPPSQLFGDLKRIASLGDSEDYVRVMLKSRGEVTADVVYSGGVIASCRGPSFTLRGERGVFEVQAGAKQGVLKVVDPDFKFPRRRSSVRLPDLADLHEHVPTVEIPVELRRGVQCGPAAFWRSVYDAVRIAAPTPFTLEEAMESIRLCALVKKTSPFGR